LFEFSQALVNGSAGDSDFVGDLKDGFARIFHQVAEDFFVDAVDFYLKGIDFHIE
jgi:hypothetical protein